MTSDELAARVMDALNTSGIPYMTVGSFSTNLYGIYRSTRDADFVIQAGPSDVSELAPPTPPF